MSPAMSAEPRALDLSAEKLRFLIYGDFGRGKTTFAGTFPRPLFISTNAGLVSLAVEGVKATTFEPEGYEDLEGLYFWIKEQSDDYDTIVIDTLDSLCFLLMDEMTEDAVEFKRSKGDKVSLRMQFVPEQGDYFGNQRQMNRFLNHLRMLDKHIVITSSMREKKGRTSPNVSQGMEKVACDFVDFIGELIIADPPDEDDPDGYDPDPAGVQPVGGERVLLLDESNARATKSRLPSLKPYIVEPTFEKVRDLIEAAFAATKPAPRRTRKGK